jgi:hypothetical protein
MNAAQSVTANFSLVPTATTALTPTSLSFTAVSGATSAMQAVSLSNTGSAPLSISSIVLTGTGATSFNQTNTCGSTLAAGASCSISLTFTPLSAGSFAAQLSVTDSAAGSPQTVALSGTGTAAPSFTLVPATGSQAVQPGGSASYSISVNPVNGAFSGIVALAASGLPAGAKVTFNPATVGPGSTGATSLLTIQTAVATTASAARAGWLLATPVLSFVGLLFVPNKRRRRWITLGLLLFASLGALTALSGCGGGFALPVASSQTYTITITGTSGAAVQTTTVQLTVQ